MEATELVPDEIPFPAKMQADLIVPSKAGGLENPPPITFAA